MMLTYGNTKENTCSWNKLTDLAKGHPVDVFPSFPVYRTFSIRSALPWTPVLVSKSFRKVTKLLEQPARIKAVISNGKPRENETLTLLLT